MIQKDLQYNPEIDTARVDELPQFECNIEAMLANGTVPDGTELNYNGLDMDEIGPRPEDAIDAAMRMRNVHQFAESKTESANDAE